jgi:hypothetical protein
MVELPRRVEVQPCWREGEGFGSGWMTAVTAWHDGWVAVMESCITELGLTQETRLWIAVDAQNDRLTFSLDADGPERSWHRDLQLERGPSQTLNKDIYGTPAEASLRSAVCYLATNGL